MSTTEDMSTSPVGYEHLKDSMGRFRTQSLFVEHKHDSYPAPFTLKDTPHKGRISLYQKYLEYGDPTEYSFAIGCFGSWQCWENLQSCDWFKPYVEKWRKELQMMMAFERFKEMHSAAVKGDLRGTKWLDEKYGLKPISKRGRPSNAEKKAHLKAVSEETTLIKEEAKRLGLVK